MKNNHILETKHCCWKENWNCRKFSLIKEVPNFDFQLIADILKKGNKFRLSIVGRHIKKRYQRSAFNCWERDSNNKCFSLKRNKKVPFSSERVFLTNIEKRHHYLVTYH